jgi:curved DNA-binding protein
MEFRDYYQTLGVSKSSTEKEIKQAFRKLARKFHPDVNPGDKSAESRFKEINEAYEVLGDAEKRRKYDELGANWRMYEQAQQQGQGWPGGSPFGDAGGAWTINMGGPGGYRTMTEEEMQDLFGNQDPFSDFFKTFFGGGGGAAGGREGRARGGRSRSQKGRDLEHPVELTLEEAFHGVSGDLYLRIHTRPHPVFERKGDDLHASVAVPVTTVVLGGEAQVPTITGTVRLKIPEATQSGQVFRLKGHGMPIVGKSDQRGDLYATVDVQLPRSLSKEQRDHYEALAKLERS